MQNRYAADVGDFGKLGMLRTFEKLGLKIGVNWYLVQDETHNADGKHIGYLEDDIYNGCDDELRKELRRIIISGNRTVEQLEKLHLLEKGIYYHDILDVPSKAGKEYRDEWHQRALENMANCDLVFLDPDNGVLPKSVSKGSKKSIKYVYEEEIVDYYREGHSVVFYNHRCREQVDKYLKRFDKLFNNKELENSIKMGVSFVRGTIRDYIFIVQPEHSLLIREGIDGLVSNGWNRHFKVLI